MTRTNAVLLAALMLSSLLSVQAQEGAPDSAMHLLNQGRTTQDQGTLSAVRAKILKS